MKIEDGHYGIGPYVDVGGHGPVTMLVETPKEGYDFIICLDCGFVTDDIRYLHHEECDRSENPITQTWREYLEDMEFPAE